MNTRTRFFTLIVMLLSLFAFTASPANAADSSLTYIIDNQNVVTVSNVGTIYTTEVGNATVAAALSNGTAEEKSVIILDVSEFADAVRVEFYELVNQHRKDYGLRELDENTELQAYADIRAAELLVQFSHKRPDGSAAGSGWHNSQNYMNTRYAENAFWSSGYNYYYDPQIAATQIFTAWKESDGHNRHILYDFSSDITMALGLYFRADAYGNFTTGAIWASGY
ncbi:MAG: CAP domain-containing protein [Peptococcaceae bacterium]|jgi:uncharacterized protein YkwD|nr:CAP domain-containing protein [Peptococcaceae bacterium]